MGMINGAAGIVIAVALVPYKHQLSNGKTPNPIVITYSFKDALC